VSRGSEPATPSRPPADAACRLLHPTLAPARGSRLAKAALNDRQRLAVVLQAAALLSHLRRAGWRLAGDLNAASVGEDEVLCGVAVEPGTVDDWGAPLRSLLASLFAGGADVGRGAGRRAARELRAQWGGELVPLPPDRAVVDVLAAAPFLWEPPFAAARRALAAGWAEDGTVQPWLAGPEGWTRRLLAKALNHLANHFRQRLRSGELIRIRKQIALKRLCLWIQIRNERDVRLRQHQEFFAFA